MWRKPQLWIGILVSIACLAAIFLFIDSAELLAALRTAKPSYLIVAVGCLIIYMLLRAVRWRFMLENKISVQRVFHLQNIGYMLTQILPLRLGDPARAVLVGSEPKITVGQGLATMVVERLLDMLAIIVLLPFTLTAVPALPAWMQAGARTSGVLAIGAIGVVVLAANFRNVISILLKRLHIPGRLIKLTDDLLAGLGTLTHWRSGLTLTLLSILPWIPIIFAYQFVMRSVGLSPTYLQAGFVVCAGALSIALPSSPGQVGVFHAGVTLAIVALGMSETNGASFAFLYHAINFTFIVALGLIGLSHTQSTIGNIIRQTRQLGQQK
jgi:uncharacterized protein (TIRG00374 family)